MKVPGAGLKVWKAIFATYREAVRPIPQRALGVAVLGSLLGQGHALSLHVPLLVATAGYLIAVALVCVVIRDR